MDLVRLPSGRILNMALVTEVQDVRFEEACEDVEDRLEVHFAQRDTAWLYGRDRAALLRYLGQMARDLGLEEEMGLEQEDEEDDPNAYEHEDDLADIICSCDGDAVEAQRWIMGAQGRR